MKKYLFFVAILIFAMSNAESQWETKGDTLIVQTLNYDSITGRVGTWKFPPLDDYEKVLMHYSLKCDPRTTQDNFQCGEWDYLTYTVVTDSSGKFDSTEIVLPNYIVRGQTPNKYYYTTEPYNYKEQEIIHPTKFGESIESRIEYPINWEDENKLEIEQSNSGTFYIDFFYRVEEVKEMKKSINKIHAIKLKFLEDVKINNFNITILKSNVNAIGAERNKSEILYLNDIDVKAEEVREFVLFEGVEIDEKMGLKVIITGEIVEGKFSVRAAENQNQFQVGVDRGAQNYIKFNQGSYIDVPAEAFDRVSDGITIAFWQYGDPIKMPQNSYIFEGINTKGQRVLNSHLPWSNSTVYWDAGASGNNYDRISKEATLQDFAGKWNHWIFTKDFKKGEMKIFLNGEEWATGTGKNYKMDIISEFKIASSANGYGRYDGSIDNFAMWNKVLTQSERDACMDLDFETNKDAVIWNDLQLCYDMNNNIGNEVIDISGNGMNGQIHGFAEYRNISALDMIINQKSEIEARPSINFIEAQFTSKEVIEIGNKPVTREYTMPKDEVQLFEYVSPDRIIPVSQLDEKIEELKIPTRILEVYPANVQIYTYDEMNRVIDSVSAIATDSLIRNNMKLYSPIVDYEIHRFITPYGIGLDLGPDGFTWVEDVTDFTPILHDYVRLSAGNQQELIDIKFLFIKGKPTRNVRSVQQLWGSGGTFEDIVKNRAIAPKNITPTEGLTNFKLLTRSSGHGFAGPPNTDNCSEFCRRTHSFWVNQNKIFDWEGWKECGDNPVFPQGGTWQIDRSDWCPGATVNTYEHELTGKIPIGVASEVDYDIHNPTGFEPYGNYQFTSYLVGYEEPNFNTDASIERIISPTIEQEFGRLNPICGSPEIRIMNNGKNTISEIEFEYGLVGLNKSTYKWEGKLEFLDKKNIFMPAINSLEMKENKQYTFEVKILKVNGIADEYERNNYSISQLLGTPNISREISLTIRTNKQAEAQYQMVLKKSDGEIIDEMKLGEFESEKTYQLDYVLEEGCYELLFENVEGYGLDLWWIRDQLGSGYINLSHKAKTINFDPDFGNFIKYQFTATNQPEILVSADTIDFEDVAVGEKVTKTLTIEPINEKGLILKDLNISLGEIKGMRITKPAILSEEVYIAFGEKYEIEVEFAPKNTNPQKANLTIATNAVNKSGYQVLLVGNNKITNVENIFDEYFGAQIVEISGEKRLEITNKTKFPKNLNVDMYEINGKFVKNLLKDKMVTNQTILPLNVTSLSSGVYIIRLEIEGKLKDLKFININ